MCIHPESEKEVTNVIEVLILHFIHFIFVFPFRVAEHFISLLQDLSGSKTIYLTFNTILPEHHTNDGTLS